MGHPLSNVRINREEVEKVLSAWKGRSIRCTGHHPLTGGMIHAVYELCFDTDPQWAVLKVSSDTNEDVLRKEYEGLRFLNGLDGESSAPSLFPAPYFVDEKGEILGKSVLLMERLPGTNLGEARLGPEDRIRVEEQLARYLGNSLHRYKGVFYGDPLGGEQSENWVDWFEPRLRNMKTLAAPKLSPETLERVDRILDSCSRVLGNPGPPTLVHGDIWDCNILVNREDGGEARLTGLVDSCGLFADVEYELAYLEVFNTVSHRFFEVYERIHPPRPGYALRRQYYWLHTLLIHVHLFGDLHYAIRTDQITKTLLGLLNGR